MSYVRLAYIPNLSVMKRYMILLSTIMFFMVPQESGAQIERFQVQFIYNFTRLVQWPGLERQLTFRIGVLGKDQPITKELLESAHERNVAGKPIEIIEFESLDKLTACHILFVPNSQLSFLRRASNMLLGVPVLIITEAQDFTPNEAVINLYVDNERMRYRLSERRAEERNLTLSRQIIHYSR
ncbi:protein of unknown function [Alkalitalea saponilacus]|uniref:YfiR family protein n=2 Tax=Alkalitalea saponilacus TaxID=889453 RepID=A0A1T5BQB2_9BACT|nr:protein of unknown function [Alkalitalea saponilacus]